MDWIEAKPSNNFNNKYLLFCLSELFNFKLPKEYLELIIDIVKNSKIFIFEKDIIRLDRRSGKSDDLLGNDFFSKCISLTNVTIPNSVISLGVDSFYGCVRLTNVNIPNKSKDLPDLRSNSVVNIGNGSFSHCVNLREVVIPDLIKIIGNDIFNNCVKLTSVTIPNSVIRPKVRQIK